MIDIRARLAIALAVVAVPFALDATTYAPKTDNSLAAIDIRTGKLLWTHKPAQLSDAHFEVYRGAVVAFPHYEGTARTNPIALTRAGKLARAQRVPRGAPLAKSAVHWPPPAVALANGWRLAGYSPGNTKTLRFVDRAGKAKWQIATGGYPHQVRSWRNIVFYAFSYLSDEGVLYAYKAGKNRPAWKFDINKVVTGRKRPLTRMSLEVLGDVVYAEANEHVFAIAPATGKLLWHRDLASDLGLRFEPDFFGGALNLAVFARAGDVLLISFENRVVALDTKRNKYLWHLFPDTFPHTPYPAAHDGVVYLTLGAKHKLTRVRK